MENVVSITSMNKAGFQVETDLGTLWDIQRATANTIVEKCDPNTSTELTVTVAQVLENNRRVSPNDPLTLILNRQQTQMVYAFYTQFI